MRFDYLFHGILGRPYRLHVTHHGNQNGPVVVLLHGIAASSEDWGKVLPHLEKTYHCITIDLLGFGESPKPTWAAYTMQDHMRSLFHTINRLRLKQQFILVGHSLGSLLAARYATQHERNLTKLVLLSPPVYPPLDSIPQRGVRQLTGMLLNAYKIVRTNPKIKPETFKALSYVAPMPRTVTKHPEIWVPFMRTLKECIEKQTVLDDVAALSLPIDVAHGTLDQVVLGANVRLLVRDNVTLHEFMGTHDLTTRYGKVVAKIVA